MIQHNLLHTPYQLCSFLVCKYNLSRLRSYLFILPFMKNFLHYTRIIALLERNCKDVFDLFGKSRVIYFIFILDSIKLTTLMYCAEKFTLLFLILSWRSSPSRPFLKFLFKTDRSDMLYLFRYNFLSPI
jgi:hypothetical protein